MLIDTLRSDHVGAYGYDRPTTPFLDLLAARGLVFERAIAQAPWTGASMASIWTSRYPSEVGAGVLPDDSGRRVLGKTGATKLRRDVPTVSSVLGDAGYRTYAFVANAYAAGVFGLLRGYDVARQRRMDAETLTDAALEALDEDLRKGIAAPFFLYVHYIDAHEPTFPPREFREQFPSPDGEPHTLDHARWKFQKGHEPGDRAFESFRNHKIDLYDASIRFIDTQVERIARHLEAAGVLDDTVFVIASDHGEEFWDHADFEREHHLDPRGVAGVGHGQSLFGELTDVPLLLSGRGIPAARVASAVRNVDIAPTIYRLAGISVDELGLRGVDLLTVAESTTPRPLDAFSQNIAYGVEATSLQRGDWKLIRYSDTKRGETEFLYHRATDHEEMHDRRREHPEIAAELRSALDATIADMDTTRGERATVDEKTKEQLRAIGYLE